MTMTEQRDAQMPKVSVIIPTYNCAEYLAAALESVFQQTLKEIEVVVVDDGSTDNTQAIMAPWRSRVVFIVQNHAGVSAARNAGIAASSAPYIAFLDADDSWMPGKLENQVAVLEGDRGAGMVCADFSILYDDGRLVPSFFERNRPLVSGDLFTRMVQDCFAPPSATMLRRDILRESGTFDPALVVCEDLNLWLRISLAHRVAVLPEVLCVKRDRGDNRRPYELTITSNIVALGKLFSASPAMPADKRAVVARQMARLRYDFGKYLLVRNQRQQSRENLRGALRARPLLATALLFLTFCPAGLVQGMIRLSRSRSSRPPMHPAGRMRG